MPLFQEQLLRIAMTAAGFSGGEAEELRRAMRYGTPLSLAMIDLDDFKVVNDRFGHAAGDRTLHSVARVLRTAARVTDFVARYGGEEFTVLLPPPVLPSP